MLFIWYSSKALEFSSSIHSFSKRLHQVRHFHQAYTYTHTFQACLCKYLEQSKNRSAKRVTYHSMQLALEEILFGSSYFIQITQNNSPYHSKQIKISYFSKKCFHYSVYLRTKCTVAGDFRSLGICRTYPNLLKEMRKARNKEAKRHGSQNCVRIIFHAIHVSGIEPI